MTDIVERLLNPANVFYEYAADKGGMLREAADEIERLREALRDIAEVDPERWDVITCIVHARAALREKE